MPPLCIGYHAVALRDSRISEFREANWLMDGDSMQYLRVRVAKETRMALSIACIL